MTTQIQKKLERLMSIDPSINNLGMAIWSTDPIKLVMYQLIHPTKDSRESEYEKSWSMLQQIKRWGKVYGVGKVICEVPEHWAVGGFEARETGSMAKLSFVCGLLYSLRGEMSEYMTVTPQQWKGQLQKKVMCNRLKEHYDKVGVDIMKLDSNVADAVGIGHFFLYGSV